MKKKWLEELDNCQLFQDMDQASLMEIMTCLKPEICTYMKNDVVASPGTLFTSVGVVLKGSVTVSRVNNEGDRYILYVCEQGGIFGVLTAFAGIKSWTTLVTARTDCTIMNLPADKIVKRCTNECSYHAQLITNIMMVISKKALDAHTKVDYLTIKSIRGKIGAYLLEQYKRYGTTTFMMPLKRHELADFLNTARPSLSRELAKLKEEGIIDYHRNSMRLKNLEYLEMMAEKESGLSGLISNFY